MKDFFKALGGFAIVSLLLFLCALAAAAPANANNTNINCTTAWLEPHRALVNGDHINIDTSQGQRNAYVDRNISGGWDTLGLRINTGSGQIAVPLTEQQVKSGRLTFDFGQYLTGQYVVQWAQFNNSYFNQDRKPGNFLNCGQPEPQDRTRTETSQWQTETLNCTDRAWTQVRDVFTVTERSTDGGKTWTETGRTNNPETKVVREATAKDCGIIPDPTPLPDPVYSDWVDGTWKCDDTTVTQTRTRIDYSQPPFDEATWTWPAVAPGTPVTETQTRDLTNEEMTQCPDPLDPTVPTPSTPTTDPTTGPSTSPTTPAGPRATPSVAPTAPEPTPVVSETTTDFSGSSLAHTGSSPLAWTLGALAMIGVGAWMKWRKRND